MNFRSYRIVLIMIPLVLLMGLSARSQRDFNSIWGEQYQVQSGPFEPFNPDLGPRVVPISWLVFWNTIAINASGLDHTPPTPSEISIRNYGEQLGPVRAARAMAIVHIAMFEALNAIENIYESYVGMVAVPDGMDTNMRAALAQAAHDTLVAMFPSQFLTFDVALSSELSQIPHSMAKKRGIDLGKRVAAAVLLKRENDGSNHSEPILGIDYFTSNLPGHWRQDPIGQQPVAMGALWSHVKPFVLSSASQFRLPAPPKMTSALYKEAFNEVKSLGGDGIITPTVRTPEQTEAGIYWAYDGTPSLCAPPRLYNQIVVQIAKQMNTDFMDLARLLALVNVALADAGIASWESKYFHNTWRPVTGIREANPGTGFTGLGDGNPYTVGIPNFTPLGAPASNLSGPNFSPPFPAYPSGHATFGGAMFQILRRFYGRDDIAFTFVSDEFNGVTKDNHGTTRPLKPRTFSSLSQAEEENGQSRIYLGIHWSFDKTGGISQGRNVANYILDHLFLRNDRKKGSK